MTNAWNHDTWNFGEDYPTDKMQFNDFNEYQDFTATTDKAGTNVNTILGLAGELGELCAKVVKTIYTDDIPELGEVVGEVVVAGTMAESLKKGTREDHLEGIDFNRLSGREREDLGQEIADVLWYASRLSARLGYSLGDLVRLNVEKLQSRKSRGVLHGKGDKR